MSFGELFSMGGGWSYLVLVLTVVELALVVVQFLKRSPKLAPVLWGCLVALIVTGPAGTSLGLTQAGIAIQEAAPEAAAQALGMGLGVANITTSFSMTAGLLLAILVGVANSRAVRSS